MQGEHDRRRRRHERTGLSASVRAHPPGEHVFPQPHIRRPHGVSERERGRVPSRKRRVLLRAPCPGRRSQRGHHGGHCRCAVWPGRRHPDVRRDQERPPQPVPHRLCGERVRRRARHGDRPCGHVRQQEPFLLRGGIGGRGLRPGRMRMRRAPDQAHGRSVHRAHDRQVRGRRRAWPALRVPDGPHPCGPWLGPAPVPFARHQHEDRPMGRLARKPGAHRGGHHRRHPPSSGQGLSGGGAHQRLRMLRGRLRHRGGHPDRASA